MKVLRVIHSAHPRSGGPINGILNLDPLLHRIGIETYVVSLDASDDPFWDDFGLEGVGVGPGRGFYGYTQSIDKWLEANVSRFDLVVIHGLWQYHTLSAGRICRRLNIPYVVYPHGMLDPWFKRAYPLKHLKKWGYWPWADYRTLRDAQSVCFTTDQERVLARKSFWLYRANESVVPYGIVPVLREDWIPDHSAQSFILYLGRIHEKKGLDLLIDAYAQWAPTVKPDLHIAGPDEGRFAKTLKKRSSQGVQWVGPLSGDEKWEALANAEAFILPSHQENFGMVVAEALSVGTPVLTTYAVNTSPDIVLDGAALVAADNAVGISQLLERWERISGTERLLMREKARQSFGKRYDLRKGALALGELFKEWACAKGLKN